MSAVWEWIDNRTGLGQWFRAVGAARVPGGACPCRALPCMIVFAFFVQVATGVFLLMRYCPSTTTAWESVYYLQYQTPGGWLLRGAHHWSGQAMLVLVGLYLVGLILRGVYRAPREFVYWMVLLLVLVTLAMLLTGDMLAWDENSRSATLTRVGFLKALPVVGEPLFKLAAAGPEFGNLTLSQFTTLHTIVFAGAFFVLLLLRWWFVRRAAAAQYAPPGATGVSPVGPAQPSTACAFYWPSQAFVNVLGCLVLLAVVFGLALAHGTTGPERGVTLGVPADPSEFYDAARPEWAFLGLYGFSKLDVFAGSTIVPIFVIPGTLVGLFLLMPFIGRFKLGHVFNVLLLVVLLAGDAWLSIEVVAKDRADQQHQAVIRQSRQAAERLVQLIARDGGIPPSGPLAMLADDPKIAGPKLFRRHCATCHAYAGGTPDDIPAEDPTAPNLFGYGSRRWIAGLLDPKRVAGPDYFGNTALKRDQMVDFVRETFSASEMEAEDRKERDMIVMALSAEAKLPAQEDDDRADAKQIAKGRVSLGGTKEEPGLCTDCHRFGQQGKLGIAPDLTGYASREWIIGIISNPANPRFYGKKNDRMQAFAETPDETKNLLTNREIEVLADWLRGEWWEANSKQ
jgi:ubiquinol-cytochrome c reductase cytochrome b subunit